MACSRSFGRRWLGVALIGLYSALAAAGCGGSGKPPAAGTAPVDFDPTTKDFGTVPVGTMSAAVEFNIKSSSNGTINVSRVEVSGNDKLHFSITHNCGTTLTRQQSCKATVIFAPTSEGLKTASVLFTSGANTKSAVITGTGVRSPLITVSPAHGQFGRMAVGMESTAQMFTVTNEGGVDSDIPKVVSHMDFPVKMNTCTAKLGPKATCTIRVAFAPTMEGERTGKLEVSVTGSKFEVQLSGVGEGRPAIIAEPSALNFGRQVVSRKSSARMVTLQNPSALPITELKITAPAGFSIEGGTCMTGTIAANASCTVLVAFTPTARNVFKGSLDITMKGGLSSGVPVEGEGVSGASITASASTLPFGSQPIDVESGILRVTLTNVGEEDAANLAVTLVGENADEFRIVTNGCTQTLRAVAPPGNSCTVELAFKPKAERAAKASLNFAANPGGMGSVELTGTGVRSSLSIMPNTADFMTGTVGETSAPRTFTIRNAGSQATGALRLTTTTDFQVVGSADACSNVALAAGAMCTVDVQFAPTSSGTKAGNLTVVGDPGGSISATLSGSAISLGALVIRPANQPFGSVSVGMASSDVVFTVENTGGSETGIVMVTTSSAQYTVLPYGDKGCVNRTLKPNETCTVAVTFRPTAVGDLTATLTATAAPGGTATSTLTGAGLAPAPITFQNGAGMALSLNDFGETVVNTETAAITVFVRNTGIAASGLLTTMLGGANAGDFTIVPGSNTCTASLPPGSTCTMQLTFKPTSAGEKAASVTVSAATGGVAVLMLKGTAAGLLQIVYMQGHVPGGAVGTEVRKASHDFGEVSAGRTGLDRAVFRVKAPVATGSWSIGLTTPEPRNFIRILGGMDDCGDPPVILAAGEDCFVTIEFQPQLPLGAKMGTLTATTSTGITTTMGLTGTSGGPLQFTPNPHNFMDLATGATRSQVFTLRNNNNSQPVTGLVVGLTGSSDYEIAVNTCPATLALNTSCAVTVRFVGSVPGTKTASLTASGSYQAEGATQMTMATAAITGTVTTSAAITLDTSSLDFGSVPVLGAPVTRTVTVSNATGAPMTGGITSPLFLPVGALGRPLSLAQWSVTRNSCLLANNTSPRTLGPGQSCSFDVTFVATATGQRSANTTISANPGGVAPLSLNATGIVRLVVEPAALDLDAQGQNVVGYVNPRYAFTVTNRSAMAVGSGGMPLTIAVTGTSAIGYVAGQEDYFEVFMPGAGQGTPCGASLAGGASCTFLVAMDTTGIAMPEAGEKFARLVVGNGDASTTARSEISGTIFADAQLTFNDTAAREFGSVRVGTTSGTHFIQVRNIGGITTGPLQVTGLNGMALTNGFRAVLQQGTNPLTGNIACTSGIQLPANGSCDLVLDFTPTAPGAVSQQLWVWLTGPGSASAGFTNPLFKQLNGTGVAAANTIYLSPTPRDFGGAPVGTATAVTETLTLNNGSGQAITIDSVALTTPAMGAPPTGYTLGASTCAGMIVAGGTCTVAVAFQPPAGMGLSPGRSNDVLTVLATPAMGAQQTATAALSGRVLRPAALAIEEPAEGEDWGEALVGTAYTRTFRVRNTGEVPATGAVMVSSTSGSFVVGADTCLMTPALAGNATCTFSVTFTAGAAGALMGDLNATAAGATAATALGVTGQGVDPSVLTRTGGGGNTISFGPQAVLSEQTMVVNIKNAMTGQTIPALSFSLGDTVNFRVNTAPNNDMDDCFQKAADGVAPNEDCNISVTFRPQSLPASAANPNMSTTLTVGGASANLVLTLQGQAVSALSISPASFDFADTAVNASSGAQMFTITNAAGTPTTGVVTVSIGGANAVDFRLAANTCFNATLAAGATCTVEVVFEPKTTGEDKTATVSVVASPTNGASATVTGDGT